MRLSLRVAVLALSSSALVGCGHSSAGSSSAAGPPPSGPALPVAPVGHEGRWLTDALGRVLLVHGVNMVNKNPPFTPASAGFSDADAEWLVDNGFRVVRVGVLATGLMPTPGVVDQTYVDSIAATVAGLAKHDVYSLVDFHQDGWGPTLGSDGFPAWMTLTGDAGNDTEAGFPFYYQDNPALQQAFQSFWDDGIGPGDAGLQEDYAAMFGALAKALAAQPYVLGYDLFNEPWPGTTWSPCLNDTAGCPSLDRGELGPAYAKALAAIRAAGDRHLVLGEPFNLFNFGVSATSVPLPGGDPRTGLAFHGYPLAPGLVKNVVENAVAWSQATGGALLDTEWGAIKDPTPLMEEVSALDTGLVPWIFWSFCCELMSSLQQPPGGTNLVTSTASVLVQAYPLAVAGVPQQLTIDPAARTLSFTWSPSRAGGGSFASGTVTTFEVPAAAYPGGYSATVSGGWITSAPCASLLTVAAKPDASSVQVEIEPVDGGGCGS